MHKGLKCHSTEMFGNNFSYDQICMTSPYLTILFGTIRVSATNMFRVIQL